MKNVCFFIRTLQKKNKYYWPHMTILQLSTLLIFRKILIHYYKKTTTYFENTEWQQECHTLHTVYFLIQYSTIHISLYHISPMSSFILLIHTIYFYFLAVTFLIIIHFFFITLFSLSTSVPEVSQYVPPSPHISEFQRKQQNFITDLSVNYVW